MEKFNFDITIPPQNQDNAQLTLLFSIVTRVCALQEAVAHIMELVDKDETFKSSMENMNKRAQETFEDMKIQLLTKYGS